MESGGTTPTPLTYQKTTTMKKFLSVIFLLISLTSFAAIESTINSLSGTTGNPIAVNSSLSLTDQWYPFPSGWSNIFAVENAQGAVVLRYDDAKRTFTNKIWALEVDCDVTTTDASGTTTTPPSITLRIKYDPTSGIRYDDKDKYVYPGAHKISLKVTGIRYDEWDGPQHTQSQIIPSFLEDIYLDLELNIERYYNLSSSPATTIYTNYQLATNELEVAWNYIQGAESYDLEWLFVDAGDAAYPFANNYDFDWRNATRVNVPNQFYRIPLAFPKGILVMRVRGVGIDWNNYTTNGYITRGEGVWTTPGNVGNTGTYTGARYDIQTGLLPGMNWAYSAGFAEDGKRMDGAEFYDGMMRGREAITTVNSDGNVIVGQTLYDYEGRPAVGVLPYPEASAGITYYTADAAYGPGNYDDDASIESPTAMGTTNGAGEYYSASSPAQGMDAAVPDAEGYPYSRVTYMNDGTNRPMKSAGAGEDLSMNSTNETQYFYGTASQGQLDRLFGNEVGYASHYKKNFVIDPNGVVSISYIDQSGNVIATALAGNAPSNLEPIDNPNGNPNTPVPMTDDLLVNNGLTINGDGTESMMTLTVTEQTQYDFSYLLTSDAYCGTACYSVCKDCVYDLTIYMINAVTGDSIDVASTSSYNIIKEYAIIADVTTFSVTLPPGTYRVVKRLTLNQANLADVRQDYIDAHLANPPTATCVPQIAITPVPCAADCHDACVQHYYHDGFYWDDNGVQFTNQGSLPTDPGPQAIAECQAVLCDAPAVPDPCDLKYQAMLADMSPGGQYFDNRPDQFIYNEITGTQSINSEYNINGWLSAHDKSVAMLGELNNYPSQGAHNFANWTDVRDNWDPNFAALLVKYHPEYCTWNYFCNWTCNPGGVIYDSGDSWDYEMATLYSTGGDVVPANDDNFYWNPLNMTVNNTEGNVDGDNSTYMPYGGNNTQNQDPRFAGSCDFNICSDPTITAETALTGYLQQFYLGKDENGNNLPYYFSVWYVATDPDDIHLNGTENADLHQSTIDFFKMLHGDGTQNNPGLISTTPTAGQVTPYQFFRSVYFYYRTLMIEQGFAANADVATCRSTFADDDVPLIDADGYLVADDVYQNQTPQGFTIYYPRSELIDIYSNGCNNPSQSGLITILDDLVTAGAANPNNIDNDVPTDIGCTCQMLTDFATARNILLSDYTGIALALNDEFELTVTAQNVSDWFTTCGTPGAVVGDLGTSYPEELTCTIDIGITNLNQAAQDNCEQENYDLAAYNAYYQYTYNLNAAADAYMAAFTATCIEHLIIEQAETFTAQYLLHEYYYTLYYYDQAGNLVKTVPPEGVNIITSPTELAEIKAYRDDFRDNTPTAGVDFTPAIHDMRSQYTYNSLQQPIYAQQNEGGSANSGNWESGTTKFWYDYLGRMVVSQNSKQAAMSPQAYSYTFYDELGRVYEVGEMHTSSTLETDGTGSRDNAGQYYYFNIVNPTALATWSASGTRNDVTYTYYDEAPVLTNSDAPAAFPNGQENLRNRVAAVVYDDNPTQQYDLYNFSATQAGYLNAYFYSYDIHGNVKQVVQETPPLKTHNQNIKTTTYEYDLVSGNVNAVHYQSGQRDEFHHKYEYDADNRLKVAYTSRDGVHWEKESKQFYYQTGGVGRVEIGDKTVQAMDYAFTINGWLKGMNRNTIGDNGSNQDRDLGQDGVNSANNLNRNIATDAAGFTLLYYKPAAGIGKDYLSVNATPAFEEDISGTAYGVAIVNQYNGNIAGMTTSMLDDGEYAAEVQGRAFTYDQLYRIKTSLAFHSSASNLYTNGWQTNYTQDNRYKEAFTYDWNGNIRTVDRYAGNIVGGNAVKSDALTYNYAANSNLLTRINDSQGSCAYNDDLDDQGVGTNYSYDAIGEMTSDVSERITSIEWTPYGKVKAVHKDPANNTNACTSSEYTDADVEFLYTAGQQRLCKIIKPHLPNGAGISSQEEWIYYWYVYDAGGNLMGVYEQNFEDLGSSNYKVHIDLEEHGVYGSGRTGIRHADDESDYYQAFTATMTNGMFDAPTYTGNSSAYNKTHYSRTIGYKQYEIANHLGNVLVTVSDKRLLYSATPVSAAQVDWYVADVQSYGDYYVFGAMQTGRTGGSYRYGFNGMEQDEEVKNGQYLSYTTEFRQYDPRVGRWMSVDPVVKEWESPYAGFSNNAIFYVDPVGLNSSGSGPIKELLDRVNRKLGRLFNRSRLFGVGNRKLVAASEVRHGTTTGSPSAGSIPTGGPPATISPDNELIKQIENGLRARLAGYSSTGFEELEASVAIGGPLFKPAQIIHLAAKHTLELEAFPFSPQQSFTLNGTTVTDSKGNSAFPLLDPKSGTTTIDNGWRWSTATKSTVSVELGSILSAQIVASTIVDPNVTAQNLPFVIQNDKYTMQINSNVTYRMGYAQVPVYKAVQPGSPTEKAIINGDYKGTYITNQDGTYSIIGGWQFAPPNMVGAKPLWKHSVKYIWRYTFNGGFNGVDLSYGNNTDLRTNNR